MAVLLVEDVFSHACPTPQIHEVSKFDPTVSVPVV